MQELGKSLEIVDSDVLVLRLTNHLEKFSMFYILLAMKPDLFYLHKSSR